MPACVCMCVCLDMFERQSRNLCDTYVNTHVSWGVAKHSMACTYVRGPARSVYLLVMGCIQSSWQTQGYRETGVFISLCCLSKHTQVHITAQQQQQQQQSEHSVFFIAAVVRISGNYVLGNFIISLKLKV